MAYDEPASEEEGGGESKRTDELKQRFSRYDREIIDGWGAWRKEARVWFDMYSGDQWDDEAKQQLKDQCIAAITWNRIQPRIDAVSGAQIQNRQELKLYPREMGDVGLAELLTSTMEWVADEGEFADEETDAFIDALICGLGWTGTYMDYEDNPDGEIRKDRVDPLEMAADPAAQRRNLGDADYIRRKKPYTRAAFDERFPEWAGTISGDSETEPSGAVRDDSDSPEDFDFDEAERSGKTPDDEIIVKEYQWIEREPYFRMTDPLTKQEAQVSPEQYENLSQQFGRHGIQLDGVKMSRKVYYRAFVAGNQVLESKPMECKGFTYHAITGKRDRNACMWYGLVRPMVDPQRWANKWMTQILTIMNRNAKGGVIAEKDAIADVSEFEESWASPDGISIVANGALASGAVQQKNAFQYPQGLDRMTGLAVDALDDVTGINPEFAGLMDRNQPGILEAQRKEAGYAMLSIFFDSLRRYRMRAGKLTLEYIQKYISDGRLVRIVGKEGNVQYIPLVRDQGIADYDVIVDEAPSGPNQKEKVWMMLVQMMPLLSKAPLPPQFWAEVARYSPLPEGLSQKIAQFLTAPPPPQVQQQQAEQMAMQKAAMQAQIQKLASEAAENMAQTQNKQADTQLKQAQAEKERLEAVLTALFAANPVQPDFNINT